MRLSRARQGVFLGAISALSVLAQTGISIGVKGGVPLADAFADRTFNYDVAVRNPFASPIAPPIGEIPQAIRVYSGPRSFLLGPTIEFRFSFALGLEADALYRPMELQTRQTTSLADFLLGSAIGPFASGLDTWEFPILAKYRISLPALQPYLEAGPAFRAISASLAEHMSGTGIAAGFGAEAHIGRLRLSPEIRYTHWGGDRNYNTPYHAVSYQNQVEFLTGLATVPAMAGSSQRSGGGLWSHLSIGVKGGFPFTHAFMQDQFGKVTYHSTPCGDFSLTSSCSPTTTTVQTFWASRNYLVGPTLEIQLPHGISIEGDSLYAPLSIAAFAFPALALPSTPSIETFNSWQFPALGKYKFQARFLSPYFEAGPIFRVSSSSLNQYLATAGVTAGLGVQGILRKIRIAPEVRFVHWGADSPNAAPFYSSRRNQAQFLLGLSY